MGFDAAESIDELGRWQDANDMPFTFVVGPSQMIRDYAVTIRSTKFGIAPDGVIIHRSGYGASSANVWRERLQALVDEA